MQHSLWVVAVALATSAHCAAQERIITLDEVVVTASRFKDRVDDKPLNMTVIRREDIQRSTARSLPELLSQEAGLQVRDSSGGPDLQIDMRGFGQTGDLNTTVLIDGQRYNDIDTSPVKWSALPLSAVERVEILRGSGAVLYGSGASGGVINLITRRPVAGERTLEVQAGAGSYAATDFQLRAAVAGEQLGLRLHAAEQRTDNYRDNNRLLQRNLLADLRTLGSGPELYLKLGAEAQDLRNPGQLTLAEMAANRRAARFSDEYGIREGLRLDLGGSVEAGGVEWALNLAHRSQETKSHFTSSTSDSIRETNSLAVSPRARLRHRFGGLEQVLVAGVDAEVGHLENHTTGTLFPMHGSARQEKRGLYVQNSITPGRDWLLTLGARRQYAENEVIDLDSFGAPLRKSYALSATELGLRYRASSALALYGKTGRSFRLPSVEENNFTGPALLEPQTSRDREIGLEHQSGGAGVRLALYRMTLENEIAFNPLVGPYGDNINLAPTRREGVELEYRATLSPALNLKLNYAHALARFRSGTYDGTDLSGKYVPLVPRDAFNAALSWRTGPQTRLGAAWRFVGEQRLINDEVNGAPPIPAYSVIDLRMTHERAGWLLEAGLRNLLGRDYYTQGGISSNGVIRVFPAAGRNGYISLQYRFH